MASLKEYRSEQLEKIKSLKALGLDLYPAQSLKEADLIDIHKQFDQKQSTDCWLAGRLMSIRQHGQIIFLDLADATARLQLIIRAQSLKQADHKLNQLKYEDLNLLTRGDFINVYGKVIKSQRGEISLDVTQIKILSKVLRPLPLKLEDIEVKRRKPYLNLAINNQEADRFRRRSMFWTQTRQFLNELNFLEMNIPVLEHTTGGAEAQPFKTHMDSLDEDFYLRISHELPLKKLLGGGYEKVYDIGPRFRNEHHSDEHLPEHVAMEFYWAYADWQAGMDLTEKLIRHVAKTTFQTLEFKIANFTIDLSQPWPSKDYGQLIKEYFKIDVFTVELKEVQQILKTHKIEVLKSDNLSACIDKLFKHIRPTLAGPFWLINLPTFMSPLAKQDSQNVQISQRFQLILAGTEACNGFSELNDPIDQLQRMEDQQALRQAGHKEAQMLDIDFIEMLEYGMPPACGLGYSERLFWLLEGVAARDGVLFPHLKREASSTTKEIYPHLFK